MHEIILSIVCIVTFVGVLCYIFFSKPKSKTEKQSPLFNADVSWGGPDAEEVFESLRKSNVKPTFKGNHKKY
ncbi:MAG: hypothetical protein E7314_04600 [Clostridiales bacterium]|nr:hypothetical protein [Clostridiales bacterium]